VITPYNLNRNKLEIIVVINQILKAQNKKKTFIKINSKKNNLSKFRMVVGGVPRSRPKFFKKKDEYETRVIDLTGFTEPS
jgi:hypothetical protein